MLAFEKFSLAGIASEEDPLVARYIPSVTDFIMEYISSVYDQLTKVTIFNLGASDVEIVLYKPLLCLSQA